jgi:predicted small integral membrane protein
MGLSWMAWTWPTAAFFIVLFLSIVAMGVWEHYSPGGNPRNGILGLDTTRGDRLFISWLGTGFINFGWLAFLALHCGVDSHWRLSGLCLYLDMYR